MKEFVRFIIVILLAGSALCGVVSAQVFYPPLSNTWWGEAATVNGEEVRVITVGPPYRVLIFRGSVPQPIDAQMPAGTRHIYAFHIEQGTGLVAGWVQFIDDSFQWIHWNKDGQFTLNSGRTPGSASIRWMLAISNGQGYGWDPPSGHNWASYVSLGAGATTGLPVLGGTIGVDSAWDAATLNGVTTVAGFGGQHAVNEQLIGMYWRGSGNSWAVNSTGLTGAWYAVDRRSANYLAGFGSIGAAIGPAGYNIATGQTTFLRDATSDPITNPLYSIAFVVESFSAGPFYAAIDYGGGNALLCPPGGICAPAAQVMQSLYGITLPGNPDFVTQIINEGSTVRFVFIARYASPFYYEFRGPNLWDAACASNATSSVAITRGGFRYNFGTGKFTQTVTVKNTSAAPIQGPLSLVIDNLSPSATLFGAAGSTSCATPLGSPFANLVPGGSGALAPGASVSTVLQFVNPSQQGISYAPRVLAGSGVR